MRIDVTWSTFLRAALVVAAVWVLIQLWQVIVLLTFSMILVGTLNPTKALLTRLGLGRHFALAVIGLGLAGVTVLLTFLTLPALLQQVNEMIVEAPARQEALAVWLEGRPATLPLAQTVRDAGTTGAMDWFAEHAMSYSSSAALFTGYFFTAVVLAFYLLADPERSLGVVYAMTPRRLHVRLARIILRLETIVGGYVRGQLVTSAAMAVFAFTLLTILGVENALALAVFAGLVDVIPFVGGVLAALPAVIATMKLGIPSVLVVVVAMGLYQELESRIIVPRVYGRVLRLSSASVITALLVGGTLLGIIGALLALPVAAALLMVLHELRVEMPGDGEDRSVTAANDVDAERRYELLSEGLPATEAAGIAVSLAREAPAPEAAPP